MRKKMTRKNSIIEHISPPPAPPNQKVCEKVEAKGQTTYQDVADDLVHELSNVRGIYG